MANDIRGLRILVTGASSGVGEALVTELARRGAVVLIHGRDPARLATVGEGLRIPNEQRYLADLSRLAEVSQLARAVAASGPLDVLVNNAGVGFGRVRGQRELSADGFELRFAVNFLAPFLLTESLLALELPRRALINVASAGQAPLDRSDLQSEHDYDGVLAYRRSKLALILDTFERAKRDPSRAYLALHPGTFLATKMVLEAGIQPQGSAESGALSVLAVIEHALAGESGSTSMARAAARPTERPPTQNSRPGCERVLSSSARRIERDLSDRAATRGWLKKLNRSRRPRRPAPLAGLVRTIGLQSAAPRRFSHRRRDDGSAETRHSRRSPVAICAQGSARTTASCFASNFERGEARAPAHPALSTRETQLRLGKIPSSAMMKLIANTG